MNKTQFYKNIPVFLPVFVGIIDQVADGALKQKVISLNADTFRDLSGKNAIIFGGAGGLGQLVAEAFREIEALFCF